MTVIAGPVEEITLDGRRFTVAADSDAERDLGGKTIELMSNGDGSVRKKMTPKPWKLGGLSVEVSDARSDQEFLTEKALEDELFPITITFSSGITYSGTGTIVGDISYKSGSATADIELGGEGQLEQQ
jgi:hypothetical protein